MAGRPRKALPKAGSGVDAAGDWSPAFAGQRPPFVPGNQLATKAGDRALLKLKPRAAELAERIRELVPIRHTSLEPVVEAAALVGAQCEAAFSALADADPADAEQRWLDERAARWSKLYLQHLGSLGLTPTSAAKLGLNLTQAAHHDAAIEALIERGRRTRAGREESGRDLDPLGSSPKLAAVGDRLLHEKGQCVGEGCTVCGREESDA